MRPPLWYLFAVQAVMYSLGLSLAFGFAALVIIPPIVWLSIHQWIWLPLGKWLGYALVGVPIGIMMAGVMTVYEWTLRTTASSATKFLVAALISGGIISSAIYTSKVMGDYIESAFPPEISAKTATENNPNDAPNPYTSLINSGGNNTIGGIPISSPSPTNPNRAK